MHSHTYNFTPRQLAGVVLPTLVVLAALAILLHSSRALRWLPPPSPRLDPDRVVLAHQAAAARSHQPARIILLGDSTCLMGVDAAALQQRLPGHPPVLSLALFIWLGLDVYGDALATYAAVNPGQVCDVVLLVTPSKLVGAPSPHSALQLWQEVQPAPPYPDAAGATAGPADWLGASLLRQRLLSRVLDTPLHGSGATHFGFVSRIDQYMTAHQGSLVEFGNFRPQPQNNSTELALPLGLETETRALRARLPHGARLFIGLTPGPKGQGLASKGRAPSALLEQWNGWLQADALLTNLPPALPDVCFSPSGHLNELGQARFTAALARELAPRLRR